AVESLGKALLDKDPTVSYQAAVALSHMGAAAADVLASGLKAESVLVRRHAARALGELGKSGAAAVPALVAALKDKDDGVRFLAPDSLRQIDPAAAKKAGLD